MSGPEKTATFEDYAALTFVDSGPEFNEALGNRDDWLRRAAEHWGVVLLAASVIRKNQDEMAEIVTHEPEAQLRLCESFWNLSQAYEGLSDVLNTAHIRMMAGLARASMRGALD